MPSIKDINVAMEKKIDLTPFFGEEAFITIKRMGKYNFSFLLNKNRQGYTSKLFSLIQDWKEHNPEATEVPAAVYEGLKDLIPIKEGEERLKVENEVDRSYYEYSIKKDGHNFTDEEGKIIELDGSWFYEEYASLVSPEGKVLNDFLVNQIVSFNHRGIILGESNASR